METFSALLALCVGNTSATDEFPAQRQVTRSFDVFFYLRLNERFSKQWRGWWFETPLRPLWRHCTKNQLWMRCYQMKLFSDQEMLFAIPPPFWSMKKLINSLSLQLSVLIRLLNGLFVSLCHALSFILCIIIPDPGELLHCNISQGMTLFSLFSYPPLICHKTIQSALSEALMPSDAYKYVPEY